MSYVLLESTRAWRPIPGCPGRSVRRGPDPELDGWMEAHGQPLVGARCPDPVWLWRLSGGGAVLSYRKADGRWLHTLNDESGLHRKCTSLGVPLQLGG